MVTVDLKNGIISQITDVNFNQNCNASKKIGKISGIKFHEDDQPRGLVVRVSDY
jgi:hypothetical protein